MEVVTLVAYVIAVIVRRDVRDSWEASDRFRLITDKASAGVDCVFMRGGC
jgi:hypothetical protein